jgi:four helix bundle protein
MEDRNQRSEWVRGFEELEVFQRGYRLSLEIHRASLDFPRIEQFALADQVRRGSKSICANLAEGFGRQAISKAEFRRFVTMALGSADEMQVWALYCRDLGYVDAEVAERWRGAYRENRPDAHRPLSRQFWSLTPISDL